MTLKVEEICVRNVVALPCRVAVCRFEVVLYKLKDATDGVDRVADNQATVDQSRVDFEPTQHLVLFQG